jgi:hypothetical protein
MTGEIEFEQYECLRIDHENFSLLYYPSLKIMNALYFDIEEDDEEACKVRGEIYV